MSDNAIDEYYGRIYAAKCKARDEKYNQIIQEFESLSLEEKVDKLIKIYASEIASAYM